jgi:hypothetical protein
MLHSLLSWCGCGLCNPVAGADTRQSIFERPMKRGDQRLEHIVNVPLPGCACWEHKTTPYYIYMITSLFHIYNIINRNENNMYIIHMCIYILFGEKTTPQKTLSSPNRLRPFIWTPCSWRFHSAAQYPGLPGWAVRICACPCSKPSTRLLLAFVFNKIYLPYYHIGENKRDAVVNTFGSIRMRPSLQGWVGWASMTLAWARVCQRCLSRSNLARLMCSGFPRKHFWVWNEQRWIKKNEWNNQPDHWCDN